MKVVMQPTALLELVIEVGPTRSSPSMLIALSDTKSSDQPSASAPVLAAVDDMATDRWEIQTANAAVGKPVAVRRRQVKPIHSCRLTPEWCREVAEVAILDP
jgi:hypothetical protein